MMNIIGYIMTSVGFCGILWDSVGFGGILSSKSSNTTKRCQGTVRYRAGQTNILRTFWTSWATWSTIGLDAQLGTDGGSDVTNVGTQATPSASRTVSENGHFYANSKISMIL